MTNTSAFVDLGLSDKPGRSSLLYAGEIVIDGSIETGGSICTATMRSAIAKLSASEPIVLRFRKAYGGSVEEALRINVMLRDSGRKVVAHIEQAASAATIVAMAAAEITLVEGGEFMIHDPYLTPKAIAALYERVAVSDLQMMVCRLIEARELFLDVYAKRTGTSRSEICDLMQATTFFTPEDALRLGFIDRVLPALPPEETDYACLCADCPRYADDAN